MADVSDHLERQTDLAMPEVLLSARFGQFALDLPRLAGYDEALKRCVFRRVFESLRPDLGPLPSQHVENLLSLVRRGDVGASVELPDGVRARLEHGSIAFSHGEGPPEPREVTLEVPGTVEFEGTDLSITAELVCASELGLRPAEAGDEVALFDWSSLRPPLSIRPRREGDRFQPFGMEGTQSLKDLFINSKIAFSFRQSVPILFDQSGVLWVVGVRRSARAPVTDETGTVLAVTAAARDAEGS
jgi:tRNA(Ile)-lysidine synthase